MEDHKPLLLYVEVKNKLIDLIHTMQPHERLPSRNALVTKYKVARTTIERAVSELIGEGYLYAKDGSGTYVAAPVEPASVRTPSASWGLVIPNIMSDVYPALLRAVEDVANQHGIHLIVCNTDNNAEKQTNYINKLMDSHVQALVIVPVVNNDTPDISPFIKLKKMKIPFVFCNRGVLGVEVPLVTTNNYYGAYIAVKYLLEAGYRRIAYISTPPLYSTSLERYQGYISALSEADIEVDENLVAFGESIDKPGYEDALRLLSDHPRPGAFFCFNDTVATGVYEAITDSGLMVGKDIGLIGYGNNHVCEKLPVKLSSVNFDSYQIGLKSVEILLKLISGEYISPNKLVIFRPQLIVRDSSDKIASASANKHLV